MALQSHRCATSCCTWANVLVHSTAQSLHCACHELGSDWDLFWRRGSSWVIPVLGTTGVDWQVWKQRKWRCGSKRGTPREVWPVLSELGRCQKALVEKGRPVITSSQSALPIQSTRNWGQEWEAFLSNNSLVSSLPGEVWDRGQSFCAVSLGPGSHPTWTLISDLRQNVIAYTDSVESSFPRELKPHDAFRSFQIKLQYWGLVGGRQGIGGLTGEG